MSTSNSIRGKTFDVTIPPGKNYDKAEFRIWLPDEPETLRGILVAGHGSNHDSRHWLMQSSWIEEINSRSKRVRVPIRTRPSYWKDIAIRHGFALLGLNLTDHSHEQMFIEEYAKVDEGSGQALLDALSHFADQSDHPELDEAPIAFWGISAGGQFSYEFACWRPRRTICFTINKGGIYYTALAPRATRDIPGILYIGEKDSPFRTGIVKGIFSMNRRANALWTLVQEPDAAHEIARSLELSEVYFDDIIPLRLPDKPGGKLRSLDLQEGYLGDLEALTYAPYDEEKAKQGPATWLPTERIAKAWQAVSSGNPQ